MSEKRLQYHHPGVRTSSAYHRCAGIDEETLLLVNLTSRGRASSGSRGWVVKAFGPIHVCPRPRLFESPYYYTILQSCGPL
jgi:hypothetical protein